MRDDQCILLGWWLFVICALLFIYASWRAGDVVALAGSIAFLAANAAFMIPVYRARKEAKNE